MTTGERMKERRKNLNIPVENIANALGVSIATIYRYESGDIEKLPGAMLEPLAKILCTTPAYLMGWSDEDTTPTTIGDRIRTTRINAGITQTELGNCCGASKQTIYKYENNIITNIPMDKVELMAAKLGVSAIYLMGWDTPPVRASNIIPMPKTYKVPLLGSIACGSPILATENIEGEVDTPDEIKADFALRCKGDSMINANIFDGYIVYIRQQDMVDNGEIAAVLINDEATLKRVRLFADHISLEPENPMYKPLVYWGEDMNTVRIIGKAVAFTGTVQ